MTSRDVEFKIDFIYDTRNNVSEFVDSKPSPKGLKCLHGLAVPPKEFQLGYAETDQIYLDVGREEIRVLKDTLERYGCNLGANPNILEFGCAAGRLTRWVNDFFTDAKVWGVDIDARRIAWAKSALTTRANFIMNTKIPHLPFGDETFALSFAYSVFSHLDDLADAWLLELRRVAKPGGYILVTIMDDETLKIMQEQYSDQPLPTRVTQYENMYKDNSYLMFSITRDSVADVWYRQSYFLEMAKRYFDVVSVINGFHGWQTGVILQKN